MLIRRTALIATAMLFACSRVGIDQRLSDLELEEERRQAKLDTLRVEIASAERRITASKAEAEYEACRATRARLDSEIAIEKAECLKTVAERGACLAKNQARTSKGAGVGCVAGWIATAFTAGAATPIVLLGCGSGLVLSEATKKECGETPACAAVHDPAVAVLHRNAVSTLPACLAPSVLAEQERAPPKAVKRGPAVDTSLCRSWKIDRIQFSAPGQKRSGEAWDVDGSGPDLEYTITMEGRRAYRSPKYETLVWNHSPQPSIAVLPGQALLVELVDHDLVSVDRIADFTLKVPSVVGDDPLEMRSGRATARMYFKCAGPR